MEGSWRRFDDVFETLEWELQRADKDLRRLTATAAYLREHYYCPKPPEKPARRTTL